MRIHFVEFRDRYAQPGLNTKAAYAAFTRFYCDQMTTRGLCPLECPLCFSTIDTVMDLHQANNKIALLVWKAKDAFAQQQENDQVTRREIVHQQSQNEKPLDFLFKKEKKDGFQLLADCLEQI